VATINGTQLKLFNAQASEAPSLEGLLPEACGPGEIVAIDNDGVVVATGAGLLKVRELQKPGGRRLHSAALLAGFRLKAGERFGPP